jgi:uncharacterized membrane protein YhaH (DUF805 family)
MNCPQCGGDLADQTFCPHCGAQAAADADVNPYAIGSQVQPEAVVVYDPDAPEVPGFFRALRICFWEKYFSFEGRASRSEFWFFFLMILAVEFVLFLFSAGVLESDVFFFIFFLLFRVVVFWPLLAATIRRYCDVGLAGWTFLAIHAVCVGLVSVAVLCSDNYIAPLRLAAILTTCLLSVNGGHVYFAALFKALEALRYDIGLSVLGVIAAGMTLANLGVLLRPGKRGPNKYGPAPWKRPKERRETQ